MFDSVCRDLVGLKMTKLILQNGDGFINRQELGYVMENLGEKMEKEEIECLINEIGRVTIITFFTLDEFH